jgi:hypothetical protein
MPEPFVPDQKQIKEFRGEAVLLFFCTGHCRKLFAAMVISFLPLSSALTPIRASVSMTAGEMGKIISFRSADIVNNKGKVQIAQIMINCAAPDNLRTTLIFFSCT